MSRTHPTSLAACIGATLLVVAGCTRAPTDDPLALPGVDPATAALVARPGGPGFAGLLATASTDHLIELRQPLLAALHGRQGPSGAGRERWRAGLAAIDSTLAAGRGLQTYAEESALLATLGDTAAADLIDRRLEAAEVFQAGARSAADRIARLRELQAELLAAGDVYGTLPTWGQLAILEHRRSDFAASRALQRRAYAEARALGRLPETCRSWGQLVMASIGSGLSAAQRDTLRHWTAQAHGARLADATSHLYCLQGLDAFQSGRSAASRAAFEDGIQICREFGQPAAAVPTMVFLLRLYALLECWNQVETLLARAGDLLAEGTSGREPTVYERLLRTQLDNLSARRLAALGRVDEAHAVFARTFAAAQALPYAEFGFVGRQWFEALMEADRADLAQTALVAIEPLMRSGDLPALEQRLPFWLAWLAWQRDDLAAADGHLERFYTESLARGLRSVEALAHEYLALKARVIWPGDRHAAATTLLDGWRDLQDRLLAHEPGPEAYLDLNRNPHLRWTAQDLLADEPRLGYGLELLWRDAMLGRSPALTRLTSLAQGALERTAAAQVRLADSGAVHCVYRLRADRIVRWTADGRSVEEATLPIATDDLRRRVAAALDELAEDPGDPDAVLPAALTAELAALARVLLPASFFAAETRPQRLFVSGESFLAQFPFAVLNLGEDDRYEPLAAPVDLAYVRHGPGGHPAAADERILVVADPALDPATRRRFGLNEGLTGARDELERIRRALPAVEVLAGPAATGARVIAAWQDAGVLYFAGHAITDPLVPFYSWIPLSSDDPAAVHPGIDIKDILTHRFGRTAAVFLSACATGAPFVDGLTSAPSLGDAFLDAGAAAAVQTFWVVRDQHDPVRPDRMLLGWRLGDGDLVAAVARELRYALQGPRGVRHPFSWGAWSVNVREL